MKSNPENRDKTRFGHESAVTLENKKIGIQRNARMFNFSNFGLYIETDHLLETETEMVIGIPNSPFAAEPDKYENFRGIIRWRKPLKKSAYYFGYGIEILENKSNSDSGKKSYTGSRQHQRIEHAVPVKYELDNQVYEGTTENVSSGGVFIKTRDPVAVGQMIRIDIPVKKNRKIKRFISKVTWSTPKGFGVEFVRSD